MKKELLEAIATLAGTVIGAGILGIPYIVQKTGFMVGLAYIIIIGLSVMIVNLCLGEVVLRTEGKHQLTGYAQKYLGKYGKWLMTFSMVVGIYGALTAYTIGEGSSFSAIFGGSSIVYGLIFFAIMMVLIAIGLKAIERSEIILNILKISTFAVIVFLALSSKFFDFSNLSQVNLSNMFLPYGVILFAFLGAAAIPELKEELEKNKKDLKKAIVFGSLIPLIIYAIFTFIVIAVNGASTTEIATIGFGELFGKNMLIIVNIFAIITMATSFVALGLALREMYEYDFKLKNYIAFGLVGIVPLAIFLSGWHSFVNTLGITGAVAGGIEGILLILMFWKAKKLGKRKPEYEIKINKFVGSLLIAIFIAGIVYVVANLAGFI